MRIDGLWQCSWYKWRGFRRLRGVAFQLAQARLQSRFGARGVFRQFVQQGVDGLTQLFQLARERLARGLGAQLGLGA
jgi:hypothetical protein